MININDNNRDNLIASCLIEAANVLSNMNTNTEVLEEGARKPGRKLTKELNKYEKELSNYFMGFVSKEEANNIYKKYKNKAILLRSQVSKIPNDSWLDRYLNKTEISSMLGTASTRMYSDGYVSTSKSYTAEEKAQIKNAGKNKTFTKEKVLEKIDAFINRLESAYNKYYK